MTDIETVLGWVDSDGHNEAAESGRVRRDATDLERRLLAALTPSATTKAAYMGDSESCNTAKGVLTWDIMKLAMALIRKEAGF